MCSYRSDYSTRATQSTAIHQSSLFSFSYENLLVTDIDLNNSFCFHKLCAASVVDVPVCCSDVRCQPRRHNMTTLVSFSFSQKQKHSITFYGVKCKQKLPKAEHTTGDLCVSVVKVIHTHSAPRAVVVDLQTSSARQFLPLPHVASNQSNCR